MIRIEVDHVQIFRFQINEALQKQLDRMELLLHRIQLQGEKILALSQAQFDAILKAIDDNTTASATAAGVIQTELIRLRDLLKAGGLTTAEEQAVFDRLTQLSGASGQLKTFLETVATAPTPDQPPPVPPPAPAPAP